MARSITHWPTAVAFHVLGRLRNIFQDPVPTRRAEYAAEFRRIGGRIFEDKAERCPWCGSADLVRKLRAGDVLQRKPGRFQLDQCRSCDHIFQNPRLNRLGISYYYRDYYDGLGQARTEFIFERSARVYRARAAKLARYAEPTTWLDVGAGYGHFCHYAARILPHTAFHGLDRSAGISIGESRGWVSKAYHESFLDFAKTHEESYCAVSMFHYLEHTSNPLEELDAAWRVLRNGGYVMIELPNPNSIFGRILGPFWHGWLIPQHLHMMPPENMARALEERNFEILTLELGAANQPFDLFGASMSFLNYLAPSSRNPWIGQDYRPLRAVLQIALLALAAPILVLTLLIDHVLHLGTRRTDGGNTYRILARKNENRRGRPSRSAGDLGCWGWSV